MFWSIFSFFVFGFACFGAGTQVDLLFGDGKKRGNK